MVDRGDYETRSHPVHLALGVSAKPGPVRGQSESYRDAVKGDLTLRKRWSAGIGGLNVRAFTGFALIKRFEIAPAIKDIGNHHAVVFDFIGDGGAFLERDDS